jgi:hypothetical protein
VLRTLEVGSIPSVTAGKTIVTVAPQAASGNTWYYKTGTSKMEVTYGTAITPSEWTGTLTSGMELAPASSGDTLIQVVEVDSGKLPVGYGVAKLNVG